MRFKRHAWGSNPSDFSGMLASAFDNRYPRPFNRLPHDWEPKYWFKVLHGQVGVRVLDIIEQICAEMHVTVVNGALSEDHVQMFVEVPRPVW